MRIVTLPRARLDEARALLAAALPQDRIEVVAEEKLFGDDGARAGAVWAALEGDALVGVMATAGRWVKLLAVDERARGRGVGTALLERAEGRLRLCDHPGNYLSPGLDVRYGSRAFFERRGFVARGEVENLRAPLDDNPLVTAARAAELDAKAAARGYLVRRAEPAEREALLGWIARAFAPVWALEVGRALAGPRRAVHVAVPLQQVAASQQNDLASQQNYVAFAAADGNNQGLGWFGPAGTDPAHRGRGLGEALLLRCLVDVRGLPEGGVIAWIGPKAFYEKSCGAACDRRFVTLERP